ncbi:MAG: type III polyketide synthase [Anaerolineales bacterium]|nr:type III polyketide synthase [Anaerolineales bacterium]
MAQNGNSVAILSLGTAVPPYQAQQTAVNQWMAASFEAQPALVRWLRSIYTHSGIETRYACIPDFHQAPSLSRFAPGRPPAETATTAERMAIYERESVTLGMQAGQRALAAYAGKVKMDLPTAASAVTHLIVVSCTGFFAPGLDLALAQRLNLSSTVERTLIGFMGCAAAFNGLRVAHQIMRGQPTARVLVVCVELCSIHIQPGTERENLISASLFADGASACLVGTAESRSSDVFEIEGFHTRIKPETESHMVWQIGDHGFVLRLSPQIPDHLAEAAPAALRVLFDERAPPQFWAIHPGGRAIVDRLSSIFQLAPEQVLASRSVLRRYGNLSSATIFFVLEELRQKWRQHPDIPEQLTGVAMAFGPGLVMEMARLAYIPPLTPATNGKVRMNRVKVLGRGKTA